ncbi:MAG: S1 family peptidase [Pseudobdellovibrionaceae bacterium]
MNKSSRVAFFSRCLFTLLAFVFTACSGVSNDEDKKIEPAKGLAAKCQDGQLAVEGSTNIIGGQIVNSGSWLAKSTVMLIMRDASDPSSAEICTGALVDRNVVLTAGHCVFGKAASQIFVFFHSKPECTASGVIDFSKGIPVHRHAVHPSYKDGLILLSEDYEILESPGDIALIQLSTNAPQDWRTSMISATYLDPKANLILAAGFGKTTTAADIDDGEPILLRGTYVPGLSAETKRRANLQMRNILQSDRQNVFLSKRAEENLDRLLTLSNYFESNEQSPLLFVDQRGGSGICQGDSGGAAFARKNSKYYIIGVASFVSNPSQRDHLCSLVGAYTNTLKYKNWLNNEFLNMRSMQSSKTNLFE